MEGEIIWRCRCSEGFMNHGLGFAGCEMACLEPIGGLAARTLLTA